MKAKRFLLPALIATGAIMMPALTAAQPAKKSASSPRPEWMDQAVIYEANLRQATPTRDLKGLQRELPRIKDLGADIIWLMPIHPISHVNRKGTEGSYYAVADYKAVNPQFGTLQDLKEFVATAHNLGLKVILDEVCNHTGCDNRWVSEYPGFYATDADGNMYGPYDWTDTYKLDYSDPGLRAAMTDALLYWIREADIDGYRCDVAGEVPTDFWETLRPRLEAEKPMFMLAEASKPELLEKAFDADYAWPMKDLFNAIAANGRVNSYAREHKQKFEPKEAIDIIRLLDRLEYENPSGAVHMNMVTNHDLNSWEGTEFERYGDGLGAFAVLSYTLPGIPMMYTGQETGFNHAFEFFENDSVQPNYEPNQITTFYEMLNSLKHSRKALASRGGRETLTHYPTTDSNVIVFSRRQDGDEVIVAANLSPVTTGVKFPGGSPQTEGMTDWFQGTPGRIPSELNPWQYIVLVK